MIHLRTLWMKHGDTVEAQAKKLVRVRLDEGGTFHVMLDEKGEVHVYVSSWDAPAQIMSVEDK